MQFWLLGALLPHAAAAFVGPTLLRPRLPALRTGTPALVLEHAAPVLDSVTTSLAFADQAGNLAGALFPASLPPYLLFLYFICQDVNGLSAEAKAGFTSLLGFVFMTVATSIVSTKTFGLNLANVDWLHSGAEQLLSFTNVANVIGLKLTLDAYNAGGGATPAPSGGLLSSKVLPAIGGTAALFFAATWAAAGFDLGDHSAYLGGIGNLPDGVWTLGSFDEPANALSLPTWVIHVSSLLEWLVAMGLVWRMAEASGNPRWKGLTWAMIPSHSSGVCACVYHFFYNAPSLQFVVLLQAALTLLGNCTLAFASWRLAASNGWEFALPSFGDDGARRRRRRRRRRGGGGARRRRGRRRRGGGRVGRRGGRAAADPRAVDRRELRDQIRRDAAPLRERRRLARGARRRHAHDPRRHRLQRQQVERAVERGGRLRRADLRSRERHVTQ